MKKLAYSPLFPGLWKPLIQPDFTWESKILCQGMQMLLTYTARCVGGGNLTLVRNAQLEGLKKFSVQIMAAINIHCCRWVLVSVSSLANECKLRTKQQREGRFMPPGFYMDQWSFPPAKAQAQLRGSLNSAHAQTS